MVEDKKEAPKTQPQTPAAPKLPAPTQDELNAALEAMVTEAEAMGHRDDPAVANARALLDRKGGGKDASKKG